jgi:DNA polymerase I-like protein with 3'-5' exonuclease and polymerase domains
MGAKGLREYAWNTYGVSMTDAESQYFLTRFFEAYQGVAGWHKQVRESATNESRTILGRRRIWDAQPKITELLNSPVQGSAADIAKRALSMLPDALQGTGVKIIGCVHDEIILESSNENLQQFSGLLKTTMVMAGKEYLKKIPLEVELDIMDSWAKGKGLGF